MRRCRLPDILDQVSTDTRAIASYPSSLSLHFQPGALHVGITRDPRLGTIRKPSLGVARASMRFVE